LVTRRAALDVGLPLAVVLFAQVETWTSDSSAKAALALLALAMTVPLFWLRNHALLAFVVVMSGTLVIVLTHALNPLYVLLATTLACYSTAAYVRLAWGLWALIASLGIFALVALLAPDQRGGLGDVLFLAFIWGGAWGLGRHGLVVHARREVAVRRLEGGAGQGEPGADGGPAGARPRRGRYSARRRVRRCRSLPTAASATPATSPRRSRSAPAP